MLQCLLFYVTSCTFGGVSHHTGKNPVHVYTYHSRRHGNGIFVFTRSLEEHHDCVDDDDDDFVYRKGTYVIALVGIAPKL